jgi:hypothetical protein
MESNERKFNKYLFYFLMFIIYQYSETNTMQFIFSLLRIKGLYMLRTLLAHPQEVLYKRYLVHYVRVMSVGCTRFKPGAAN